MIEQSVATPLEQQMNGVEKMLYMQSTNANDGTMTLTVTFDVGERGQHRPGERPEPGVPGRAESPHRREPVRHHLSRARWACRSLVLAIYSPKETYDSLFLGNYALINVNDALYRVPGVGQVVNFGLAESRCGSG